MSGPKVVRIVTREENVVNCRTLLSRLDQALNRWIAQMRRTDLANQQEISEIQSRRDEIASLIDNDRFREFQEAASAEMVMLENDVEKRFEKEAERQAQLRTSRRRITSLAQTLISSLEQSSVVPKELIAEVRMVAASDSASVDAASSILNRAFLALTPAEEDENTGLTEEQKQLVSALGDDVPTKTLNEWLAGAPNEKTTNNERIDGYVVRLQMEYGETAAAPYFERLQELNEEPNASRKRMLADTLVLELAGEMTRRKERTKVRRKLEELAADLSTISTPTTEQERNLIAEALVQNDPEQWIRAITRGQRQLDVARADLAAKARRDAILTELARLGYEVREGMETALAIDGRVVIQKASNSEYGVEVFSAPKGQLQLRAIAFGDEGGQRNAERDRDMETIWCSEFSEISQAIAETGGEISIVVAKGVGEVPLKIVPAIRDGEKRRPPISAPKPIERKAP